MWERTLQDLIRGLRANKKDESKFIAKAVDEIRHEIKSEDMELKAGAVLKLTYVRLRHDLISLNDQTFVMLARYVGIRYGMGFVSCGRSYVLSEISLEECGVSSSSTVV